MICLCWYFLCIEAVPQGGEFVGEDFSFGRGERDHGDDHHHVMREKDVPHRLSKLGSSSTTELDPKAAAAGAAATSKHMPPASVMTRLILIMVWRKLIRNPNTYSSLIGLIWSLVAYRSNLQPINFNVLLPQIPIED